MAEPAKAKKPESPAKVQTAPAGGSHIHTPAPAGPAWAGRSVAPSPGLSAIQRKVTVGEPGDPFEKEAERVADRVAGGGTVRMSSISTVDGSSLGRAANSEEKKQPVQKAEEKKPETKAVQRAEAPKKPDEKKPVQKAEAKKPDEKKSDAKPVQKAEAKKPDEKKSEAKPVQKAEAPKKPDEKKPIQKAEAKKPDEKRSEAKPVQKAEAPKKPDEKKPVQKAEAKKPDEKKSVQKATANKPDEKKSDAKPVQKAETPKKPDAQKPVQTALKKDSVPAEKTMGELEKDLGADKQASAPKAKEGPESPEPPPAPQVQASPASAAPSPSPAAAASHAIDAKGPGAPLAPSTRGTLEGGLDADLSHVRVHDDSRAHGAASSLNARAFTHQNDIWLGRGESQSDTRLMAHEATHVIQQSNSVQRSLIQRTGKGAKATGSQEKEPGVWVSPQGSVDTNANKITIPELELPAKADKSKGVPKSNFTLPKEPTPRGNQRETWKSKIKGPGVDTKPEEILTDNKAVETTGNQKVWYLQLGKIQSYMVGDKASLKERLKLPNWFKGTHARFDVDHVKELQLGGDDDMGNYQLLDASANRSSGSRIKNEIQGKIQAVVDQNVGKDKPWKKAPDIDSVRKKYAIIFEKVSPTMDIAGDPKIRWTKSEIADDGAHLDYIKALSSKQIENAGLRDEPTELKVFLSTAAGKPRIVPWSAGATSGAVGKDSWGMQGLELNSINFTPGESGTIKGRAWHKNKIIKGHPIDLELTAIPGLQYSTTASGFNLRRQLASALSAVGASPIEIFEADLGPNGIVAAGVIRPDISILKGTEIDFTVDGDDVTLSKTFSAGELKLPGPVQVTGGSLTISAGTRGLELDAGVTFMIERVGSGSIGGKGKMAEGFEIRGTFDFETQMFDPAKVEVAYKRPPDGEGEWSGSGELGIKPGTITGIKSANIRASFEKGVLAASGNVKLSVPGVKEGSMEAKFSETEGISIGGKFQLADDIPGISGGSIEAKVEQKGDRWAVTAKGSATPKIPGVNATLTVAYEDGAITIEGQASYEKGMLKGSVLIGATNRPVDEGGHPGGGPGGDALRAYGGGSVTIKIAPWLQGTVGIKLLPNGEVEISGEVALPSALDIFPEKKIDKNIFSINIDIPIVGVAVAGQRIGIFATIGGGLDASAGIGPGQLQEARLGVTYNPAHEDQTHVTGAANFHVPAKAGLRLFVRGGLGAGIPIVSATAGIEIGGQLGLEGAADASVNVDWTPAKGLVLDAKGEIFVEPKLKFDITGFVKVEADLLITTVDLYEKRWQLAGFEWGSGLRFGIRFPLHYEEGKPFNLSLSDVEFVTPPISAEEVLAGLIKNIA